MPSPKPTPEDEVVVEDELLELVEDVEEPEQEPAPVVAAAPVEANPDADIVRLSKCKYKNVTARKSLSVHHLQRRLNELGYTDAYADKDGWYGDLTKLSVLKFQADAGLDPVEPGIVDADTLQSIFVGDPTVVVSLA